MPGKRDPPLARRAHPCAANVPEVRPVLAQNGFAPLSKPACDVVFRPFVGRGGKYLFSLIEFNKLAQQKKASTFSYSRPLLLIVSHDHYSKAFLQLEDQFLDFSG